MGRDERRELRFGGFRLSQEKFEEAQIFEVYSARASCLQANFYSPVGQTLHRLVWVISAFTLVGIVFVPIGVALLLASNKVVEIVDRYDTACVPDNMANDKVAYVQNERIGKTCTRILTIPKDMGQPIYVYYQLDNFYQNHRRYLQSRSDAQLQDAGKANDTSNCAPEKKTSDGSPIIPCGLIAWSLFNDTYSFVRGIENLAVNKKGISWKSDREHKFGKDVYPKNFQNGTLIGGGKLDPSKPLSEQEDLIVWMRTAALPTFRKLYGKIETDLKENDKKTITTRTVSAARRSWYSAPQAGLVERTASSDSRI